jgi:hypothetical protein
MRTRIVTGRQSLADLKALVTLAGAFFYTHTFQARKRAIPVESPLCESFYLPVKDGDFRLR